MLLSEARAKTIIIFFKYMLQLDFCLRCMFTFFLSVVLIRTKRANITKVGCFDVLVTFDLNEVLSTFNSTFNWCIASY